MLGIVSTAGEAGYSPAELSGPRKEKYVKNRRHTLEVKQKA